MFYSVKMDIVMVLCKYTCYIKSYLVIECSWSGQLNVPKTQFVWWIDWIGVDWSGKSGQDKDY
jgi:hypothetical protein